MTTYLIKRDGETVGTLDDELLADEIDGIELSNEASDPAYREHHTYTVERADG